MRRTDERKALRAIGENVRRQRVAVGLSQEKLGFATHLDRTYIGGIERGERNCTVLKVCLIAKALGVEPDTLLRGVKL
jgi:transcriptional regulator with XRE-family HTH domain